MGNALLDRLLGAVAEVSEGVRPAPVGEVCPPSPAPPAPRPAVKPRPDAAALAQTPGHCGCCARWTPTGYPLEGECSAGRRAHGWPDGNPDAPVLTTPHHTCAAYSGRGWKAREGRA